ncbi:MAG TPA: hypothetical protein DIW86_00185 [Pseudomonas sp.]|jgi:hypothetical protein|nr:hypothetical protein [Pseudomonas sp.]
MHKKRFTDLSLGFYSNGSLILHPANIEKINNEPDEIKELADNCHIYLIVSRPRASYLPGSIVLENGVLTGILRCTVHGVEHQVAFTTEIGEGFEVKELQYPFVSLRFEYFENPDEWFSIPAHLMSIGAKLSDKILSDLEVEYVGMSYAGGKRSAKDRLLSHSTLQAVMADMNRDQPDREVMVVLERYEPPQVFVLMNGRDKSLNPDEDRDIVVDINRAQNEISKDLQICLVEAGLIKYFQPKYNDIYKKRFPHPSHEILKEVYSIDFGAVTVEINSEDLNVRLGSVARKAGFHHIANFDLHDPDVRTSFFNVMNVEGGPDAERFSGPIY